MRGWLVAVGWFAVAWVAPLPGACERWSKADAKMAADNAAGAAMIEAICAPDSDACAPAQVRGMERVQFCTSWAQLTRHNEPAPASTIHCPSP